MCSRRRPNGSWRRPATSGWLTRTRTSTPYFVPQRARWGELRKASAHLGDLINKACSALEEHNPTLEGVLAGIDFNDEHKLGDARNRDTVLSKLILHFSEIRLRPQDIDRIVKAFRAFRDEERFCRAVSLKGIEENDFNLNISRYVDVTEEEEIPDVYQALRALREAEERRNAAEARMNAMLKEMGYE